MNLLDDLRQWLGESRRNQLLAVGVVLAAGGAIAGAAIAVAVSGGGDGEPQVIARTASPPPSAEVPTRTPRRTATAAPTPTSEPVETLAFIRDGDVWLINADGSDERKLTELGNVQSFAWVSPGELDVVTEEDRSGHLLVALDGGVRQLPFPGATSSDAGFAVVWARGSWSRDGRLFAVPLNQQLVVFDESGAEVKRLPAGPPIVENPDKTSNECGGSLFNGDPDRLIFGPPAFSADGGTVLLAVECASHSGAYQLYSGVYQVTLDGAVNQALASPGTEGVSTNFRLGGEFLASRFAPDGDYVAQMGMGGFSICPVERWLSVAKADGTEPRTLAPSNVPPNQGDRFGGIIDYAWSPASDAIVASFDVSICQPAGGPLGAGFTGLFILKADGSGEEKLLDSAVSEVAWSPSGQLIAFIEGKYFGHSQPSALRVLDLRTREVADLGTGSQPAWQPQP